MCYAIVYSGGSIVAVLRVSRWMVKQDTDYKVMD